MADVLAFPGVTLLAGSTEEKAEALETLAAEVRSGALVMKKTILVYLDEDGMVRYEAMGERMSLAEAAGMLAFAQHRMITSDD